MSSSPNKTTVVSHGVITTAGTSVGTGATAGGGTSEEQEARLRQRLQASVGDAFQLLELLGRGGMGIVFRAREIALDREVALKVLTLDPILNPDAFTRFEREARLAARLDHPNIVPIFAVGSRDSLAYYTMRLVRGGSVEDLLAKGEPLPLDRAVRILRDVAAALDYAHRTGVVHRDIKPANILLGESGHAMVADFGIAKGLAAGDGAVTADVTGAGVIGSPAYMSPEQWRGDMVDGRADQYALGVVAYEMLVGRRPFESPRVQDLLKMHMAGDVPDASLNRPGLDAAVGAAIRRAMSKYSSERFGTATAFVEALAGNRPAVARAAPRPVAPPPVPPKRRRRVFLPLLLLGAALTGTGLAIPATRPRTLAALERVEAHALEATAFVSASLGLPAPRTVVPDDSASRAASAPLLAMAGDSASGAVGADSVAYDSVASLGVSADTAPVAPAPLVRPPLASSLAPDSGDAGGFRRVERPEFGVVHVVTRGGSARVRVDGQAYGFSPQLLHVPPGRHHVTVEGAGDAFLPTQVMLTVAAGDTALAEFATPSARAAAAAAAAPASRPAPPVISTPAAAAASPPLASPSAAAPAASDSGRPVRNDSTPRQRR